MTTSRTRPSSPASAKLTANRDKADLSYMLGTIRKDAPSNPTLPPMSATPATRCRRAAAGRAGNAQDGGPLGPERRHRARPIRECRTARDRRAVPCRCCWRAASTPPGMPTAIGTCAGQDVYLPDADRLAAILDGDAEIWAFDAKPLYRLALEHGGIGKALRFDGKLAAYL